MTKFSAQMVLLLVIPASVLGTQKRASAHEKYSMTFALRTVVWFRQNYTGFTLPMLQSHNRPLIARARRDAPVPEAEGLTGVWFPVEVKILSWQPRMESDSSSSNFL